MSTTLFPGTALVTGAASGIGRSVTFSFAKEGCQNLVICDTNEEGLQDTQAQILAAYPSTEVMSMVVDVSQEDQVQKVVSEAARRFHRIDYAVNVAGIFGESGRSTELSTAGFDQINNVNYRGCWLCGRAELTQMLKQEPLATHDGRPGNRGSIVHIASQLGITSRSNAPAYCASKAAIISLTKSDAIDYSQDNIRINCVCPGVIDTPLTSHPPERKALLRPAIAIAPMNRMGTAQEVADCVLFLCSSKATFVQGAAFVVDGGYTII
ncbi:hypothetical protein D9758_005001 [Tetrapyrgos nigripes]|uniref:Uncharacterized protein n=1 Tax=Tetrapyrgos nigripes TaxID=182062 RepID=A0A8H5GW29_9AGAR|nr:hypothetical protein D9758_005001 [Tetrapyrgos nigripes]